MDLFRSEKLVFDLDGTLWDENFIPDYEMLNFLENFYEQGGYVILYTARGMKSRDCNVGKIIAEVSPEVLERLEDLGVKYHEIHFGKPYCGDDGYYIDDRALHPKDVKNSLYTADVVIPMNGDSSRFGCLKYKLETGIDKYPTMFELSLATFENQMVGDLRFIFICRDYDAKKFIEEHMPKFINNYEIIITDSKTNGQASTVLYALPKLQEQRALLIYNIDTYLRLNDYYLGIVINDCRGSNCIITFKSQNPGYSYVKSKILPNCGNQWIRTFEYSVSEVKEKEVISDDASVGLYIFRDSNEFLQAYANTKQQDEIYIAPLFNDVKHNTYKLDVHNKRVYILGTPEEFKKSLEILGGTNVH
jgi:capsule biosynthesis phosphatase